MMLNMSTSNPVINTCKYAAGLRPTIPMAQRPVIQKILTNDTHIGLCAKSGATKDSVAVAAGIEPETIKIAEDTRTAQPVKNPKYGPKISDIHAYDAPAFALTRFK